MKGQIEPKETTKERTNESKQMKQIKEETNKK